MVAALRVLADPARLRIPNLIANHPEGEVRHAQFTGPFGLSQPTVSHHLQVLHEARLLRRSQRGSVSRLQTEAGTSRARWARSPSLAKRPVRGKAREREQDPTTCVVNLDVGRREPEVRRRSRGNPTVPDDSRWPRLPGWVASREVSHPEDGDGRGAGREGFRIG